MKSGPLNILILTYFFPPDGNISSRRWAKFAKYLALEGHHVSVLAAETKSGSKSPWDDDIVGLKVYRYRRNYPEIIESIPKSILQKIKYKIASNSLKNKVKGSIYDRSVFLEKIILDDASEIITSNKIDVLITNGPPHRVMYYGSLLKNKFPDLFLVSDFRDPWTWWYNLGYPGLIGIHKEEENRLEKFVFMNSDLICAPSSDMLDFLEKKYGLFNRFHLPHGFDTDDIPTRKTVHKSNKENFKLIYFGSLYDGETKRFEDLAKSISENRNVTFDIYTSQFNYSSIFEKAGCGNRVNYFSQIPSKDFFQKLTEYDAIMMIVPDKFKDIFSSKFYEIIYSGIPVILITEKGKLSDYITNNKSGIYFNSDIKNNLDEIFNGTRKMMLPQKMDLEEYDFKKLTQNLVKRIIESKENKVKID